MKVLAADIGGTSLRAAAIDESGAILDRRSAPTPPDPSHGLELLDRLWSELGPAESRALVVAGGVRTSDGEITESPNLPRWEGSRPGAELQCPILNDANGALLGEAWLGALTGRRSALLVTLGTGVGGGVWLDGRLWTGATGCAGEIGQVPLDSSTLEQRASATAVARAAGAIGAEHAARRARDRDVKAQHAFEAAGRALGVVLAGLVNVFNPEAICLAGGMAGAFDLLEPPLRKELEARCFRLALEGLVILPAALGPDAGLIGAARLALDALGQ